MKIPKHQYVSVSPGALLVAAIMASVCSVSHAAIVNGDFSAGLTGWNHAGDASAQTSFLGVSASGAGAVNEAALTTLSSTFGGTPVSGVNAATPTTVDSTVGLGPGGIGSTGQGAMLEASGIGRSLTLSAGDFISFKWNFITGEQLGGGNLTKDFGFYTFNGNLNILARSSDPLSVVNGDFSFPRSSGWQTTTIPILAGGTYTLGFGVADGSSNPGADSALGIASVAITPVPEPWAWSLVSALALGGLAAVRRFRYNHA